VANELLSLILLQQLSMSFYYLYDPCLYNRLAMVNITLDANNKNDTDNNQYKKASIYKNGDLLGYKQLMPSKRIKLKMQPPKQKIKIWISKRLKRKIRPFIQCSKSTG